MSRAATFALALAACLPVAATGQQSAPPAEMHRRHHDPEAMIRALEDPARDEYQKPDEVVAAIGLRAGDVVADIGAGTGYFTVRLARAVGDQGRVYAVDISPEMIRYLTRRVRDEGLRNVVPVLADADDPLLPDASVDWFVVVDTWHHIEDQAGYLYRMKRMLRPGGKIVHIDFQKRDLPVGPPMEMKVPRDDLVRQMQAAGFRLDGEHDFLPYQYFLVFAPE